MLVYSSVNEEFAKVSDAGLQELSIVESEQNNSQVETPAAHFKKNSFGKDFKHYVMKADKQRASQESKSSTNLKPKDTQELALSAMSRTLLAELAWRGVFRSMGRSPGP